MAIEILSVVHANINCSDLARSTEFYTKLIGLQVRAHTNPDRPQDGSGFGLSGPALWDAHMMADARQADSTVVDLLEWKLPAPTGRPYAEANHLGMYRLCLTVPDVDAQYARLRDAGVHCYSPPHTLTINEAQGLVAKVLFCADPDGTTIEFAENPRSDGVQLAHVNINCSDIGRSQEWYQRVLGLEQIGESRPGEPVSGEVFGLAGEVQWDARFLAPKLASGGFMLDLLEWKQPKPVGRPYAEANHLGIFRLAFLVEDCRASHEELQRQGVECPPPVWLEMGPEIPVDGLWALFFPDPDGTCLELIERPTIRA